MMLHSSLLRIICLIIVTIHGEAGVHWPKCYGGLKLHEDKDGTLKCCHEVQCRPGSWPSLERCHQNEPIVICVQCDNEGFMPHTTNSTWNFHGCYDKMTCSNEGQFVIENGSSVSDRRCGCREGFHDYDANELENSTGSAQICIKSWRELDTNTESNTRSNSSSATTMWWGIGSVTVMALVLVGIGIGILLRKGLVSHDQDVATAACGVQETMV